MLKLLVSQQKPAGEGLRIAMLSAAGRFIGGLSVQGVCAEFVFENLIADIETIAAEGDLTLAT